MKPKVGETAPEFELPVAGEGYGEGDKVALSSLRGRKVVLVFYPKDDTPGCTQQACGLRDRWPEVKGKALVFGVSVDPVKSHWKFLRKHGLPYPLLADEEKRVVEDYGVWVEKSMYGKTFWGTERTTFVIGGDGRVEAVLEKVAPAKHLDLLLEVLG